MNCFDETPTILAGLFCSALYAALLFVALQFQITSETSWMDSISIWFSTQIKWWLGLIAIWSTVCLLVSKHTARANSR